MNRTTYFNYIEEKLNINAVRIEARGKLNILDLNQHSENFYNDFLNANEFAYLSDIFSKLYSNSSIIEKIS